MFAPVTSRGEAVEHSFWLILMLFTVVGGFLHGWPVQSWDDSGIYIRVSEMALPEGLGSFRTLGYPFLLRVADFLS